MATEYSSEYEDNDFQILIKTGCFDATMQACLKVISSTCLAHGVGIEPNATPKFLDFVQRYYLPFCEDALRFMFVCGFVPWRLRKIDTGVLIPETIPLGTFTWSSICTSKRAVHSGSQQRYRKYRRNDASFAEVSSNERRSQTSKTLRYDIKFTESLGIDKDDVHIYEYIQPVGTSFGYLQSPIYSIIAEKRLIARTLARCENADEWNTKGKFVCSFTSVNSIYNMSEGDPITHDWSTPLRGDGMSDANLPTEMEQNMYVRDAVMERIVESKDTLHKPTVYSLPKNSKLESVGTLQSTLDASELQSHCAKNIASLLGVPFEIVGGGYSTKESGKRSLENSRVFITNMTVLCRHLQFLLGDIYKASFSDSTSIPQFIVQASPRLEVNTIEVTNPSSKPPPNH
jgi:hypothetical protein